MSKRYTYTLLITIVLSFIVCSNTTFAQTVSINLPFKDTLLCKGGKFTLSYTVNNSTGNFLPNNIFKIILSDFNGTFSTYSPVIGQGYGMNSGTVTCTIPPSTPVGTQYRIRIAADSPAYTSPDNGVNIRVSYYPTITGISVNSPVCTGDTLHFGVTTSTSNSTFQWEGPSGYSSNNQNATLVNAALIHNDVFTAKVIAYGCTSKDTIRPIVSPPPAKPVATTNSPVCERGDLGFASHSTTPGVSYLWHDAAGNLLTNWDNFIIKYAKPSNTGNYIVTAKIGNCVSKDTVFGYVKPAPDTAIISYNPPLCAGDTLKLKSIPPQSGLAYKWTGPGGFQSNLQNPIVPNVPKSYEGQFQLVLQNNSCESLPTKLDVKIGDPITIQGIIGDTTLCPGDTLALTTRGGAGIYQWKGPNGFNYFGGAIFRPNITAKDGGEYVLTLSNNGCMSQPAKIYIEIPDIKKPNIQHNGPVCEKDTLQFTIAETDGGAYAWTGPNGFNANIPSPYISNVQLDHAGTYSIKTTLKYCTESSTTNVEVKPIPIITDIGSNGPVCEHEYIQLYSKSNVAGGEYTWSGPNNFSSTVPNPNFALTNTTAGIYTLSLINNGCAATPSSVTVEMTEGPLLPDPTNNSILNEGEELKLFAGNRKQGTTFTWTGPDGFNTTVPDPIINDVTILHAGIYKVVASYNGCLKTGETQVQVRGSSKISLELYPNPNNGKFTISGIISNNSVYKYTIVDVLQHIILKGYIEPDNKKFKKEIDLRGIPTGVYILQVGTKSYKFVVY